jgi:hypothetical protein
LIDGNPSAIRNQLSYWWLVFEARPQFQRLPTLRLANVRHWFAFDWRNRFEAGEIANVHAKGNQV